ncbi:MAG: hypothetical protein QOG41_2195 [Thermoleophilaceae bacterium]|nr:hypothetical protein [Thermoleophilaceae bacterium]
MRTALATIAAAIAAVAAAPSIAGAQDGVSGWDGKNPFVCTLQQLGGGTDFPEPKADPFCVEYDKRHQNVDKLGVVDFLSKEPARVGAAGPKCFYFQHDHWVGTVVEGNQQTQTYAWDGSYFYDKSKGTGGAYVENFSFNGKSGDPTQVPGFPTEYKPYFGEGRGGVQRTNEGNVDPNCVAKAKKKNPYVAGPGGAGSSGKDRCRVPGGSAHRGIGGIRLRQRRRAVRHTLGPPTREALRWVSYCMTGRGRLAAAFNRRGKSGRVLLVATNARPFDLRGIRAGQTTSKVRKKLARYTHLINHRGGRRLLARRERKQLLLVGTYRGRVMFVAVARPKMSGKRVKRLLRRTPSW